MAPTTPMMTLVAVRTRVRPTSTRIRMRASPRIASASRDSRPVRSLASMRAAIVSAATTRSAGRVGEVVAEAMQGVGQRLVLEAADEAPHLGSDRRRGDRRGRDDRLLEAGRGGDRVADHLGPRGDRLGPGHDASRVRPCPPSDPGPEAWRPARRAAPPTSQPVTARTPSAPQRRRRAGRRRRCRRAGRPIWRGPARRGPVGR